MKVLVADESKLIRNIAKSNLSKFGINDIFEAVDPDKAIVALVQHPDIKLLITDIDMSRSSGIDMIRKIRNNKKFSNIKIVVITSVLLPNAQDELYRLNVKDFITKPFDLAQFNSIMLPIIKDLRGDYRLTDDEIIIMDMDTLTTLVQTEQIEATFEDGSIKMMVKDIIITLHLADVMEKALITRSI
jgi:CheY-like chemotaxis protein